MKTIGFQENIGVKELNIRKLTAKIDTGAESCAIHCNQITKVRRKGEKFLKVTFLLGKRAIKEHYFENFQKVTVVSSNGHRQKRYKVDLTIILGGESIVTKFTLSNRKDMNFPVLLGRNILCDRFIVDVSKEFLQSKK